MYARVNNTEGLPSREWASWTGKIVNVAVQSTISSPLNYMDFSEETTAHFNAVAQSMLTLGVLAGSATRPRRSNDVSQRGVL